MGYLGSLAPNRWPWRWVSSWKAWHCHPGSAAASSAHARDLGGSACTQPRAPNPIPELPSHPGAQPIPRDRYQELLCLVANRAGAGARRSCLCACGCSGNLGPARGCQNHQWPGSSPWHGCPGAAWPAEPPTIRLGEWAKGLSLLGPAEHNQTGGVSADGVLLQRGSAASFGLGFTKAAGGRGGSSQRPLPMARQHQALPGCIPGLGREHPGSTSTNSTAGSELPAVLGKQQSLAAPWQEHWWGRKEAAVV